MKKKLLMLFSLVFIALTAIGLNTKLLAQTELGGNAEQFPDDYNVTDGVEIVSSDAGLNVHARNFVHAQILDINSVNVTVTEDMSFINLKGVVDNIYRIKLNCKSPDVEDGSTLTIIRDIFEETTVDENGVFELHYQFPEEYMHAEIERLSMQMYIESGVGSIKLLGAAFDAVGTYDNFSEIPEDDPVVPIEISDNWTSPSEDVVISETDVNGIGKVDFNEAFEEEAAEIAIPVNDFVGGTNTAYISLKYGFENISDLSLYMYYSAADESVVRDEWGSISDNLPENEFDYGTGYFHVANLFDGFNVTNTVYEDEGFRVSTANISGYISSDVVVDKMVLSVVCTAGAYLEMMGMEFTADGEHSMEVPKGELTFSDIAGNEVVTVTKDEETGEQTLSYETSPGYNTVDLTVTNYDRSLNIFEIVFTPSDQVNVCFDINGTVDWTLGHKTYGARKSTQKIDVSGYDLPSNFTIRIYVDAEVTVDGPRSIVIHDITFKTPDPEPEGLYLSDPITHSLACLETAVGWEVSYVNDGSESWRSLEFVVNNYTTDYDVLAITMTGVEGMKLGIRAYWLEADETESHGEIRNHWENEDSIFEVTGEVVLVFNFNAIEEIRGNVITKIVMYFDPPTSSEPYLVNEGEQTTTISDIEFLQSSELDLDELDITAEDMEVTYSGEAFEFVASNVEDLPMIISYKSADDDEYTTTAPTNAGVYDVKIVFPGNLSYDYKIVEAVLTINKADRDVTADEIVFDEETGEITFGDDVIVATSSDFSEETLLTSGTVLSEDTVVYVKLVETDNYNESDAISVELELVVDEDLDENPDEDEDQDKEPKKKGCFSQITGSSLIIFVISLSIVVFIFIRKRNTKKSFE